MKILSTISPIFKSWYGVVLLVLFVLFVAEILWRFSAPSIADTDPLLLSRTVLTEKQFGDIIFYTYLGDPLPDKLIENEVAWMRTNTSYSREVEIDEDTVTLETVSYPYQTFVQDAFGVWYYVEHATTTHQAWEKKSVLLHIAHLASLFIISTAYAVTDTIYSIAGGDGHIIGLGTAQSPNVTTCRNNAFSNARSATTGTVSSSATTFNVYSGVVGEFDDLEGLWTCDADIYRGFLPFDTSSIPSGASISSATLNVYATAKNNGTNDGTDYITVIETTQTTHSSLASGDFDNVGTTEGVDTGQRKDIGSITTSAYLTFTLNSTGLGFINESGVDAPCSTTNGISCFGLREGHDMTGTSVTLNTNNSVTFSSADNTGTTQDPYLSVTYTVALQVYRQSEFWFD